MRATSESAEWIFLATNLGLEMLSAACDQASSPRRPHYALFGMLLAIAAVLISIWELIYRGKKERVVLRRWGMLWWFYHPPPPRHTPFGTLPDIYGLVAGISQCICSIVQYVYCLRHSDTPFKASLLPAIFLVCLGGSKLSNNRLNANTTGNEDSGENSSSTEETSLHTLLDDQEVEVEGNIEQQWLKEKEQAQEQEKEHEHEQQLRQRQQRQQHEQQRLYEQKQELQQRQWLQVQEIELHVQEEELPQRQRLQEQEIKLYPTEKELLVFWLLHQRWLPQRLQEIGLHVQEELLMELCLQEEELLKFLLQGWQLQEQRLQERQLRDLRLQQKQHRLQEQQLQKKPRQRQRQLGVVKAD